MSRTKGARDRRPRKRRVNRGIRSDKGKQHKKYRGKPTKKKRRIHGRFVPYVPKSQRKEIIKLWFWKEEIMPYLSYLRFPPKLRTKVRRIIYKPTLRVDAPVYDINTKEKIELFCQENLYEGTWLMMGFSHGKNKYHVKPVKLAKIRIREYSDGLRARVIYNYRLFRYWFWRGR